MSGCASPIQTQYSTKAKDVSEYSPLATIYFIRGPGIAKLLSATAALDGKDNIVLNDKSYTKFKANEGIHEISLKWSLLSGMPSTSVKYEIKENKTYYFIFTSSINGIIDGRVSTGTSIRELSFEEAKIYISTYKQI